MNWTLVKDVTIPLLSLWAGAEHEALADAEFEPVARLWSIGEIAH